MMEHILASNIRQHLDENNILSKTQHGFRKRHSCETQLLTTVEDLASSLDAREQVDCLILDFSKAFDSVPHQRLLHKIEWYGIGGNTHRWIKNWLTSRVQNVVVDGERSKEAEVISGVPQGTVLGPLLFILYINDIGEGTSSTIRLFADDALIYRKISSTQDAATLQKDLDTLVEWSKQWQMRFNPAKCSLLRVTRKRSPVKTSYTMMGTGLETMDHHPYLGVELASGLEWKHHIKQITGKAQRTLNFLQRNLHRCPQKVREQAYVALVRPTLEYAATVWDPYHQKEVNSLERVQRKAVRFITRKYSRRDSVSALRSDLGLPTLKQRRLTSKLTMFYKIHHQEVAVEIPNHYVPSSTPSIKTRKKHTEQYNIISTRSDTYKHSFYPSVIPVWNQLPESFITSPTTPIFKNKIQEAVCSGQPELYIGSAMPATVFTH